MSYRVEYTHAALLQLNKLDPQIRREVFGDIDRLGDNPRPHGVSKLEARKKLYRVYVGPGKHYHAIHQIQETVLLVLVVKVGDRKEVWLVRRICG